ncbi:MAG: hypothetical protein V1907_02720 [Candidatus Kerfeldbacteria bacterium]
MYDQDKENEPDQKQNDPSVKIEKGVAVPTYPTKEPNQEEDKNKK